MTTVPRPAQPAARPGPGPAEEARELVRKALKCALGTLASQRPHRAGDPYVSLVTVAATMSGAPLMLISKLALHTQNLAANSKASLLFDGTSATGDPLAGGRVTLMGRVAVTQDPANRCRFLERHPASAMYAGFPDFAFYEFNIESAHFIGGFGRIVDLKPADLLIDLSAADALAGSEADVVAHMNADHADALKLYATRLGARGDGPWRMTGLDPEGFDLVCDGDAARLRFAQPVNSPDAARREFVSMAAQARAAASN